MGKHRLNPFKSDAEDWFMECVMERVEVNPETGCWVWKLAVDLMGYGRWNTLKKIGLSTLAHRAIYQKLLGIKLLDSQVLDHICRNPPCVNPAHLQPVSHAENLARGAASRGGIRLVNCMRGHNDWHYWYTVKGRRRRYCRSCQKIAMELHRKKTGK